MNKVSVLIVSACFLLAGCESEQRSRDSHFDEVSREIERLKKEAQAAPSTGTNIKITVNFLKTGAEDYTAVDTAWRYVNQNVYIAKRPDVFARSGLKVGVARNGFRAQLGIIKEKLKSSEETELYIVVADGSSGSYTAPQ